TLCQVWQTLERRTNAPRRKLLFPNAAHLSLGLLAAGDSENLLENLAAHGLDGRALQDNAGVDVHVVDHVLVHGRVGCHLDRRRRLAAEHGAAAGGKDQDVGAARDDAGHAHRVVTGRVHDDEAPGLDRLGVADHIPERRAATLGDGPERLLVNGRQPAFLVAGRRVVIDLRAEDAGVPFPPLDALDELFPNLAADGTAGEQVLGAIDFRRFADDAGPALAHEQVGGYAERRIGGDAAVAV